MLGEMRMKRYAALLIGAAVFLSCVCGGCGKQPAESPTDPVEETVGGTVEGTGEGPVEGTGEGTGEGDALSVYVVQNDALYADAIDSFQAQARDVTLNVTAFHSYEAMLEVMNGELMAGGGPDVVLYNSMQVEVDGQKLARSGMFLPLEDFMGQLDPAVYPAALMDAGKIAGKQYFVPFSYNLIYAFTTENLMDERGYSPSDSIYELIPRESEALANDDNISNTVNIQRLDPVNSFFDAAGVTLFDKNTGDVIVDKAEVEAVCSFVKSAVYDNWKKKEGQSQNLSTDLTVMLKQYSFFTEDYAFMNNVRFYQSMLPAKADSPMVAMPYHKLNDPQALCASIACFGGVNANTKAPEKAYGLLKYILDYDVSSGWSAGEEASAYYAPVSLTVFQKAVEKLSGNTGFGPVEIAPLTEENGEGLMESAHKITGAVIPNMTLGLSVQESLEPYFMGEDSFESCYNALLSNLRLYLGE